MGVRVRQRPDKPGWWLFIDHQGKQKKKHFTDKETALKAARQIRERMALGDFGLVREQPEAKPFSTYFETWLNGYGPTRLKLSTQDLYWSTFTCHLKPFFGDTEKNGSGRRIDVSRQLAETLRALHVERKKETLQKGWREVPPWVFLNGAGNPVDPDNFRARVWPKILSKAELRHFPTHSLRHTFASRLIQNGATLLYVQHAMGHHSAAFTLQVYGHFQPTGNRSEVDKLDLLLTERTHDAKKTG